MAAELLKIDRDKHLSDQSINQGFLLFFRNRPSVLGEASIASLSGGIAVAMLIYFDSLISQIASQQLACSLLNRLKYTINFITKNYDELLWNFLQWQPF